MANQAGCSSWSAPEPEDSEDEEEEVDTSNSSLLPFSPSALAHIPEFPTPSATVLAAAAAAATTTAEAETQPELSEDGERYAFDENAVSWNAAPDLILAHVLSYLSDVDRYHASLTCKSWRHAYTNPSLWRSRYFVFRNFNAFNQVESYQKYLAQLGCHMKNMSIELSRPNINTASIIAKAFEQFVNAVNKTPGIKLLNIRIISADFHTSWNFFSHARGIVVRSLCNLLKKQSYLRSADLSYSLMDRDDGSRVLDALSYGTRLHPKAYLRDINLRQFFSPRTRVISFLRYGRVMGQFPALTTLRMDVKNLNEPILERIAQVSRTALRHMELDFYSDETLTVQVIGCECWQRVAERLPGLNVKVRVHGLCSFQKYTSVLARGLPLSELRVTYLGVENLADPNLWNGVRSLVVHLADYFHPTLTHLRLQLPQDFNVSADTAVVNLVRRCQLLRELHVNLALQADTVVLLLDSILRQRSHSPSPSPRKTRFQLNVTGMTPELEQCIRLMTSRGFSGVTTRTLSAASGAIALTHREQ